MPPLYEYQCTQCSEREERLEPVSAPGSHTCPQCGGTSIRQVSAGWFQMGDGDLK